MWIRRKCVWPLRRWISEFPKYHWIFLIAQITAGVCAFWWWHRPSPPPPGYAVAVIAVLAALMSIQTEMRGWQKAIWMLVIGAFLFVELRAINSDRTDYANAESKRRRDEQAQFQAIADGINTTIERSDQQFAATIGKTNQVLQNVTGGDSFGFVVPQPGGPQVPLLVWNHGDQPLTGVTITIARTQDYDWGMGFYDPIFIGTFGPHDSAPVPRFINPSPEEKSGIDNYWIMIAAQNGSVSQTLNFRKNHKGTVPWAYSYFVSKPTYYKEAKGIIPKGATVMKTLLVRHWSDEVDEPH